MRKIKFDNNSIYHICNRGVEKREIFLDDKDYYRFIHDLYEFNDQRPAENTYYRNLYETGTQRNRSLLVEILAFCLMPNHFHLLLKQLADNGISIFMNKLGGYSTYFNKKYERIGSLFQGRFRAIRIERQEHFIYIPYYIHLNPLDLVESEWREGRIKNLNKAVSFLYSYRWSSYLDYTGKKNFPSIIQKNLLLNSLESQENYKKETLEWLKNMTGNLENIKPLTLE